MGDIFFQKELFMGDKSFWTKHLREGYGWCQGGGGVS